MQKFVRFVAVAALLATSLPAYSQAMPNIERRVSDARERVHRGFRNGDLTRGESDRLHGEIDAVERMMRRARQDGHASDRERQDIRDELTRVERDIERLTHNTRRR